MNLAMSYDLLFIDLDPQSTPDFLLRILPLVLNQGDRVSHSICSVNWAAATHQKAKLIEALIGLLAVSGGKVTHVPVLGFEQHRRYLDVRTRIAFEHAQDFLLLVP